MPEPEPEPKPKPRSSPAPSPEPSPKPEPEPKPKPNQVRTLCSVLAKMDPEPMVSQFEHSLKQKPGVRLDQLNLRDEICIALLGECSNEASAAHEPIFSFEKGPSARAAQLQEKGEL